MYNWSVVVNIARESLHDQVRQLMNCYWYQDLLRNELLFTFELVLLKGDNLKQK